MSAFETLRQTYEGIDDPDSFDELARARYRDALLAKTEQQLAYLSGRLPDDAAVFEVGTGNGRLLIGLAQSGRIAAGLGIDLATSRIAFAQDWARDLGENSLVFAADNVFDRDLPERGFDAAICITGAYGYFDAFEPGSGRRLLATFQRTLRPGGLLVLELYQYASTRRLLAASEGEVRLWHELPPSDPWRFYLSRISLQGGILTHEKTFVHRETCAIDEGRVELLRVYEPEELGELLAGAGFGDVQLHRDWTGDAYDGGDLLVATAVRK